MERTPVPTPTVPPKCRIALASELMAYLNSRGERDLNVVLSPGFFDAFLEGKTPPELAGP
jgi:hypothetical protein